MIHRSLQLVCKIVADSRMCLGDLFGGVRLPGAFVLVLVLSNCSTYSFHHLSDTRASMWRTYSKATIILFFYLNKKNYIYKLYTSSAKHWVCTAATRAEAVSCVHSQTPPRQPC